ncbi:hypothetical protein HDK64DRAFT_141286 [Phyllosticta capitalensis]
MFSIPRCRPRVLPGTSHVVPQTRFQCPRPLMWSCGGFITRQHQRQSFAQVVDLAYRESSETLCNKVHRPHPHVELSNSHIHMSSISSMLPYDIAVVPTKHHIMFSSNNNVYVLSRGHKEASTLTSINANRSPKTSTLPTVRYRHATLRSVCSIPVPSLKLDLPPPALPIMDTTLHFHLNNHDRRHTLGCFSLYRSTILVH